MEREKRYKILIVFLAFSIGVLIYLLFRSRNLFYYGIVEFLRLDNLVDSVREIVWRKRKYIPNWVIYALPDGLWMFACGVSLVKNRIFYKKAQIFYTMVYLFFIFFEFVQLEYGGHGTAIGTFDTMDLVLFTVGYILASGIGYIDNRLKREKNELLKTEEQEKKEKRKNLVIVIIFTTLGFFPALI